MFLISILIGIFSYYLLFIGVVGYLKFINVLIFFIIFLVSAFLIFQKSYKGWYKFIKKLGYFEIFLMGLLILGILINTIGALGPELSFDALWYHLTIPNIFIQSSRIYFIDGSLFYYSLLPKLTEMLYAAALIIGNESLPKIIHLLFGVGAIIVTYKIARHYLDVKFSLLAALVFYSNLVVGWLSISAYVDLARTFYESLAILSFLYFMKKYSVRYLILSAVFLGFAISAKIVSLISIGIFILILLSIKLTAKERLRNIVIFSFVSLLIPLPWFLIAFYNTSNPFYPLFSLQAPSNINFQNFNPIQIGKNLLTIFLFSNDPINPIYIVVLPILFSIYKKIIKFKIILIYTFSAILLWYIASFSGLWHGTDQAGSTRFLVSYLPLLSVLVLLIVKSVSLKELREIHVMTIIVIAASSIFYRTVANFKYVPVLFGIETKQDFLMKNLNFEFGDFYDENNEIKKLVGDNLVLLHGLHNLYYVDFNYTLPEWSDSDKAKFLLVQGGELPIEYQNAKFIYSNKKTRIKLYKL